jgi:hypothetical protein
MIDVASEQNRPPGLEFTIITALKICHLKPRKAADEGTRSRWWPRGLAQGRSFAYRIGWPQRCVDQRGYAQFQCFILAALNNAVATGCLIALT